MKKKIVIICSIFVILVVASQWLAIKMVQAHKLSGWSADWLTQTYNLKAGSINDPVNKQKIDIKLVDYLTNEKFINKFLASNQDVKMTPEEVKQAVWDRLIKDAWLVKIAKENKLEVTTQELEDYVNQIPDLDQLKEASEKNFGLSWEQYKLMVIKPLVLEEKIYNFLLAQTGGDEGATKIQQAHEALVNGKDFAEVAKQFSDDLTYLDNPVWASQAEMPEIYDPVKDLKVGDFSEVIQVPGAYVIWQVASETTAVGQEAKELKAILVQAKTIDYWLSDYLTKVEVKKNY
jgi:hypothetical protein